MISNIFFKKIKMDSSPLMKDRDDVGNVGSDVLRGSLLADPELTLRLKTWTVPLSLETASHWAFEEKARL